MLAANRLREAKVLMKSRCYSGSHYLCGYSIECALKACIARQTRQYEFPDKKKAQNCYSHDASSLVKTAGLQSALDLAMGADPVLAGYWGIVKDWSEESRYDIHTKTGAENLYIAVSDLQHGVYQWIKQYW